MSLRFDTPKELEGLVPRLSSFVASFAYYRSIESPEARLREVIPLYVATAGGAAIEPSGDWYLRVSLAAKSTRHPLGVVASLRDGEWRVESLEEEGDELEKAMAWLDEKNPIEIDSTVGYFRDFDAQVTTLYLIEAELHRIVQSPAIDFERDLVATDVVLEVVRRLATLEPRIIDLRDGE